MVGLRGIPSFGKRNAEYDTFGAKSATDLFSTNTFSEFSGLSKASQERVFSRFSELGGTTARGRGKKSWRNRFNRAFGDASSLARTLLEEEEGSQKAANMVRSRLGSRSGRASTLLTRGEGLFDG